MRQSHDREDHDPPRLIRAALVGLVALAFAAPASAAHFAALPSPVAPLSPSPPLGGGASASSENVRHKVDARTTVQVSLDAAGAPFAIVATQRLDVRVLGDYFFTIGAPVIDVRQAAGSATAPGLRTGSIVWAGFDPGHRVLAARATLDAAQAKGSLPFRVSVRGRRTVLENMTGVDAGTYTADALRGGLLSYLRSLRAAAASGNMPVGGSARVRGTPRAARVHILVPLQVTGTIGGTKVSLVLRGRTTVTAAGPVHLTVRPLVAVDPRDVSSLSGRALLDFVNRASLTVARARQYASFLGNPDPTGRNETTYVYATRTRAAAAPPLVVKQTSRSWATTLGILFGCVAALAGAAVVWARS